MADHSEGLLEKALPMPARQEFAKRLVVWHLNELNGFEDQRRHVAQSEKDPALAREATARLERRQAASLEALAFSRAEVLPVVWELLEELLELPEDVFALALVLQALGEAPARLQAWRETLTEEQRGFLPAAPVVPSMVKTVS